MQWGLASHLSPPPYRPHWKATAQVSFSFECVPCHFWTKQHFYSLTDFFPAILSAKNIALLGTRFHLFPYYKQRNQEHEAYVFDLTAKFLAYILLFFLSGEKQKLVEILKWAFPIIEIFYLNFEDEGLMWAHTGVRENGGMPKYRAHWAQRASRMYVSHPLRRIGEKIQWESESQG